MAVRASKASTGDASFFLPIFELAGAAAIFAMLRRLDKATTDVQKLGRVVRGLIFWNVGLSIIAIGEGLALWIL